MSITKTIFRNDNLSLQASEVLTWLQASGTTYFDTITYDTDNSKIVCQIDNSTALEIYFTGYTAFTAYLNNNESISCVRAKTNGTPGLFRFGITTQNALLLSYFNTVQSSVESATKNCIIITKDNEGETTIISHGQSSNSNELANWRLRSGTFSKYNWNDWYGSQTPSNLFSTGSVMGVDSMLTALVPFTDKSYPIYTPNVFIVRCNQFHDQEGFFEIAGTEYYTTGSLAVSD